MRSYVKCPSGSATVVLRVGFGDSRRYRVGFQPTHSCRSAPSVIASVGSQPKLSAMAAKARFKTACWFWSAPLLRSVSGRPQGLQGRLAQWDFVASAVRLLPHIATESTC